uniref:Uncharacterized protein n=1 Tax=Chrysotila carterae TaxID=13221 RepID=A0A7S4C157_CHRCT|mmetsp:Transcript_59798/g.129622  ORF Transcript_59798/g.129622 Transcript_59798/m.129622 type:complete len:242 (+) Transcript_59798:123-848(+)
MGIKRIKRALRESLQREPTDKEVMREKKRLKRELERQQAQEAQEANHVNGIGQAAQEVTNQEVAATANVQTSTQDSTSRPHGSAETNVNDETKQESRKRKAVNGDQEGSDASSLAQNDSRATAAHISNGHPTPKSRKSKAVNEDPTGSDATLHAENSVGAGAAHTSNGHPTPRDEPASRVRPAATSTAFAQLNELQNESLAYMLTSGEQIGMPELLICAARASTIALEAVMEFARILSSAM